jgi:4-diphosphocytidyl-2-C-methyl-D-erythritol kinase
MPASHATAACPGAPVRLRAGCKINYGLAITGRRGDGYHLLDSVFIPLPEPHDELTVRQTAEPAIRVLCRAEGVDEEDNTLVRAWRLFREATGLAIGLHVELAKGIPWGAGLGGGSSDAACLLRHLQRLAGGKVDDARLGAIAARVGADVPFFLQDAPMRVTGIGDVLEPAAPDLPGRELVLVTPRIAVSTPWAYKTWDRIMAERAGAGGEEKPLTKSGAEDKDSSLSGSRGFTARNDLELAVFPSYPEIAEAKDRLLSLGAAVASMSGSGSSVFGLFQDSAGAERACKALSAVWPVRRMRICTGM